MPYLFLRPMKKPTLTKQTKIQSVLAEIPFGCVTTYGELAKRAGLTGRARLVGQVLSQLTDGCKLPWHRVLKSGGRIAFPAESPQFLEQYRLLCSEGVEVTAGRVNLACYGWRRDLDEELWKPC